MKIKRILVVIIFLLGISCNLYSQTTQTITSVIPQTGDAAGAGASPMPLPRYIPPQCAGQPVATLPVATTEAQPTPTAPTKSAPHPGRAIESVR